MPVCINFVLVGVRAAGGGGGRKEGGLVFMGMFVGHCFCYYILV